MTFYACNNTYDLSPTQLKNEHLIGEGCESFIYKFGDYTYKMYKSKCPKRRLDGKTISTLSKIPTKRILLPIEKIKDDSNKLIGYVMKYITEYSKDNVKNMKMNDFISELKLIKEDLMMLKDNKVILDDIHENNYIYQDGIYFVDPGSYMISKELQSRYVEIINRELIHEFILNDILFKTNKLTKDQKEKLKKHLPIDEYICDILDYDLDPNENVSKYVKRIVK